MSKYIPTIGIEVHVELKTNAKVFSSSKNDYNSAANCNINEIDLGYPGVLPMVNEGAVNKALKACLSLNCKINRIMHFDRKNYFYPDLPKGYQITQAKTPIGYDGFIDINVSDYIKRVGIHDIHIEEDTAKSLHSKGKTLLNYNRAGVGLVEIVSKPDMHSKEEAMCYLESLRELLFYLDVSDCKIEEGSMRADINISLSDSDELGTRAEIKNIGSISNVGVAISYEIERQTKLLDEGKKIEEETRKFNSNDGSTSLMRKKEIGNDYRYFPEPDIPYLVIDDDRIIKIKKEMILLPDERRKIYLDRGILPINVEKLINNKSLSDYLNNFIETGINFKIASNLLLGDISSYLNKNRLLINETKLSFEKFIDIVNLLDEEKISNKIFKDNINDILEKYDSVSDILKNNNVKLDSNIDELILIINSVLEKNEKSVVDYKNGKNNAFKFLMGMVIKETKGAYNPKLVNVTLNDLLSKNVN